MHLKAALQMAVFCLGLIAFNEALPLDDQSRDYNHVEISRRGAVKEVEFTVEFTEKATQEETKALCKKIVDAGDLDFITTLGKTVDKNSPPQCLIIPEHPKIPYEAVAIARFMVPLTEYKIDGERKYAMSCCYAVKEKFRKGA